MTNANPETLSPTGMFCWWTLNNTHVTPDRLRSILADENFTPKMAVPDIDPVSAIRRSCTEWSQGRGKQTRYRCEVTHEERGVVSVGLLTRKRVANKEVEWVQVGLAEFDTAGPAGSQWTVATDTDAQNAPLAAFMDLAASRMAYLDHRYIRPNILAFAMDTAKAMNLRGGSGFYFVPKQHMDEMRQIRRILRKIGSCSLRIATVGNDQDTIESVTEAARDNMMGSLNEVQDDLDSWTDSGRAIRSDSQTNALGALANLLGLADTYEAALGVRLDDLRSSIEAARRRAVAIVAEKAAA